MLAGIGSTLLYIFTYLGWFFIKGTNMLPNTAEHWLLGINPLVFGAIGAVINFGVAFTVSNMTEEPPERIQKLVEDIRVPIGSKEATHTH